MHVKESSMATCTSFQDVWETRIKQKGESGIFYGAGTILDIGIIFPLFGSGGIG